MRLLSCWCLKLGGEWGARPQPAGAAPPVIHHVGALHGAELLKKLLHVFVRDLEIQVGNQPAGATNNLLLSQPPATCMIPPHLVQSVHVMLTVDPRTLEL